VLAYRAPLSGTGIFSQLYQRAFAASGDVQSYLLVTGLTVVVLDLFGALLLCPPAARRSASSSSSNATTATAGSRGSSSSQQGHPRPGQVPLRTVSELLSEPMFVLCFLVLLIGSGVGLMFIQNFGSMVESLLGEDGHQHTSILLYGLSNALSRLLIGAGADAAAAWLPRPWWLVACCLCLALTLGALSFSGATAFLWLAPVMGVAYGGCAASVLEPRCSPTLPVGVFVMLPMLISLLFGLRQFGRNWVCLQSRLAILYFVFQGITVSASGIGSFLLTMFGSAIYEIQANPASHRCVGACWALALRVASALALLGAVLSFIIVRLFVQQTAASAAGFEQMHADSHPDASAPDDSTSAELELLPLSEEARPAPVTKTQPEYTVVAAAADRSIDPEP
jgi:hypothetical protein